MDDFSPRNAHGYPGEVHVTDVSIPLWSLVVLLTKLALASIPAIFIWALTWQVASVSWGLFIYWLERK
jgi:hypothetical protein